jgi:hypothetical protein
MKMYTNSISEEKEEEKEEKKELEKELRKKKKMNWKSRSTWRFLPNDKLIHPQTAEKNALKVI